MGLDAQQVRLDNRYKLAQPIQVSLFTICAVAQKSTSHTHTCLPMGHQPLQQQRSMFKDSLGIHLGLASFGQLSSLFHHGSSYLPHHGFCNLPHYGASIIYLQFPFSKGQQGWALLCDQ